MNTASGLAFESRQGLGTVASSGFMAIPEKSETKGHRLLLDGDPDQPIITGRTYHATTRRHTALPKHKNPHQH